MSDNNTNQKNDNERASENNKMFYNRKKYYNNYYDYNKNNSNKINSNWRQQKSFVPSFQDVKYSNNYYTHNKKKEENNEENIKQTNNWKDQVLNNQAITSFFIPLNIITKVEEPVKIETAKEIIKIDKDEFIIDKDREYIEIDIKLDTLDSLIELGRMYDIKTKNNYTIDLKKINNLIPTLEKFKNIIGMENVKKTIVNQIIYFLSGLETCNEMMHTVIMGPPGVGKTMLGETIGEIYHKLGIIEGNNELEYNFKIVKRADLIGQYLGHTAIKTQKAIDECKNGILFIDEAYSLGSEEKTDIYAKECIDTLNQNLTENKNKFICIIAGYPEQLEKTFFSMNPGLKRRFPFKYTIAKYNAIELGEIFYKMMKKNEWSFIENFNIDEFKNFLELNYKEFSNFGGDMETLFFNIKIAHAKRVACKHLHIRKKINLQDILQGFEMFKESRQSEKNNNILSMYI
jgi:hypothetical protein